MMFEVAVYLLCQKIQSALQSVGHLDFPIGIEQLNTTRSTQGNT